MVRPNASSRADGFNGGVSVGKSLCSVSFARLCSTGDAMRCIVSNQYVRSSVIRITSLPDKQSLPSDPQQSLQVEIVAVNYRKFVGRIMIGGRTFL